MRKIALVLFCIIVVALSGCAKKMVIISNTTVSDPCIIPSGYQMAPAIQVAERTLQNCPNLLQEVFESLIEVGKHHPNTENSEMIQSMLKRLIEDNLISRLYTKKLYQKYFSASFINLPAIKVYKLPNEVDNLKLILKDELKCKKIGLIEVCGNKEAYIKAEVQYSRTLSFIDNLMYNEEHMSSFIDSSITLQDEMQASKSNHEQENKTSNNQEILVASADSVEHTETRSIEISNSLDRTKYTPEESLNFTMFFTTIAAITLLALNVSGVL